MNVYYVNGIPYSSDELYHHGILGQKWGIRRFQNKDGTRTAAGKERYSTAKEQKKLANLVNKHGEKYVTMVEKSPQVKQAVKELSEIAKERETAEQDYYSKVDDFFNDKKTYDKYLNKAVDKCIENMNDGVKEDWIERYGEEGMREKIYKLYRYDDMDQGTDSSIELFKRSNEPKAKILANSEIQMLSAGEKLFNASEEYANAYLGEYGDQKVGVYSNLKAKQKLTMIIDLSAQRSVKDSNWWNNRDERD